jgi:hypothetical protein
LKGLSALVEYDIQTLAGKRVLLPSLANVEAAHNSGVRDLSFISFDHCRAFTTESVINFDEAGASQSNQASNPARLPYGTEILVALGSPLSIAASEADDKVMARVVQAVKENGRTVVDAGAAIEAHVRVIPGENRLVLELDRVLTQRGWAPFYAQLVKLGSNQAHIEDDGQGPEQGLTLRSELATELIQPEVPGVATVVLSSSDTELPAGTQMIWKTESLQPAPKHMPDPRLGTTISVH